MLVLTFVHINTHKIRPRKYVWAQNELFQSAIISDYTASHENNSYFNLEILKWQLTCWCCLSKLTLKCYSRNFGPLIW